MTASSSTPTRPSRLICLIATTSPSATRVARYTAPYAPLPTHAPSCYAPPPRAVSHGPLVETQRAPRPLAARTKSAALVIIIIYCDGRVFVLTAEPVGPHWLSVCTTSIKARARYMHAPPLARTRLAPPSPSLSLSLSAPRMHSL
jgi:hypothetical protein